MNTLSKILNEAKSNAGNRTKFITGDYEITSFVPAGCTGAPDFNFTDCSDVPRAGFHSSASWRRGAGFPCGIPGTRDIQQGGVAVRCRRIGSPSRSGRGLGWGYYSRFFLP
ncbi:MAG: hypothetical protein ABII90_16115 [Bacteroidota bacterium]